MSEQILDTYLSRRNHAVLIRTQAGRFVKKTFAQEDSFQKELQIYRLLQDKGLACAQVIRAEERTLILSELPGQTLVDCLAQQEQTGRPAWEVWDALVEWLSAFHRHTGLVMSDVNLRNFIYDETTNTLYGLDFEECSPGSMLVPAARTAAFIRTYRPANTLLKQEISRYVLALFARSCGLEVDTLAAETRHQEHALLARRKNRI